MNRNIWIAWVALIFPSFCFGAGIAESTDFWRNTAFALVILSAALVGLLIYERLSGPSQKSPMRGVEPAPLIEESEPIVSSNALPSLTAYVDKQMVYRFANRRYLELMGMTRDQIIGKSVREVVGESFYKNLEPRILRALAGEQVSYEGAFHFPDGRAFNVAGVYIPQFGADGKVEGFVALIHDAANHQKLQEKNDSVEDHKGGKDSDLTNKRLRQEMTRHLTTIRNLRRNESLFRAIFEYSAMGILYLTPKGKVRAANDAVERTLGYSQTELESLKVSDVTHPEDLDKDRELYLALIHGKRLSYQVEKRFVHKDGHLVWGRLTVSSISREGVRMRSMIASLEDITDRKELEIELAKRADALARSNKELEEFAFMASHDLNEPLDKIAAFGRLLREESAEDLSEESLEYLDYMVSAAKRMQDLIESLLDLSRVTTSARPFETVDLNQVLEEILSDYKLRIEDVSAEIKVDELPVVCADPVQMHQLFQNLIGNALKFHLPGETPKITIKGGAFQPETDDTAYNRPYCRITVKDKGIGFEQRHADRIFNPFQRLNPRSSFTGTGIGLAICRKIVDRHEGVIAARSTQGKGSTFAVMLPLATENETPAASVSMEQKI